MRISLLLTVDLDADAYAARIGVPVSEAQENVADEFYRMGDALTWRVTHSQVTNAALENYSDVVNTILMRPRNGSGGGISLTRGEVAMLFLDGHAGDGSGLLDIRSQGYGDDDQWNGLTHDDVPNNTNEPPGEVAFVWKKWEPLELWH